ncbi:hypothetical protein [Oceanicella sp. SM1341]|uniref:hypothetical protein n=1 Tax=Oceanicella sp. SM1341 TaxID=1548889 RepID=UPI000E516676|nr:hypothetical protein [Oceanicella sp. SM1341]
MPLKQTHAQARAILTGATRPSPSLASLAILALKHPHGLPALRMVTAADGSARYVPASRTTGRAAR